MNKFLSKLTRIITVFLVGCSTIFSSMTPIFVQAKSLGYDGDAIIKEAEKHIGKGYVWGATGPNVFDCSGFTQYVFAQAGYSIPRTAEQQRQFMLANTTELPKNDISQWNKGDMIFYGNNGESEHVAIYTGDGFVIDCLGSQVSSLPGVTKHKYNAITDKNGHQYAIMGVFAIAEDVGELQIQKISEKEGWALEGAVFEITNNSTGKKLTRTTDANGRINVTNLEPATYTIVEKTAPAGYLKTSEPKVVVIKGGETITTNKITFTNTRPTGKIVLTKYNYDKSVTIPNTEYNVRYPDGTTKAVKTDDNGKVILDNLTQLGTYTFTETKAAAGYIIDTYPIYVELAYVDQNTKVIEKQVEHINYEPTGVLYITKNDAASGTTPQGDATLAGATYQIKAAEDIYNNAGTKLMYKKGKVVATRVAKEDGTMAPVRGLYMGSYNIVETIAPKGYALNPEVYTVTFTKEDETKEIVKYLDVYNDVISGDVVIHKVVKTGEHQEPLAYVPFVLSDSHGTKWNNITDESGYLEFTNLPYGTYWLSEESAETNSGLGLIKDKKIVIDGSKSIYEYTIINEPSVMTFYKIDSETKEELSGAELVVTSKDGFIVDTWTSNGVGHEIFGLIEGETYILQEIKAPDNYELADYIEFVAVNGGSVTMEDAPTVEEVPVTLSKQDIVTRKELPGAQLMIKEYETNKVIATWKSGNTPKTIQLEKGKQYIYEEITAPSGYVQAEVIIFTADDAKTITMYDDFTKVSIQKIDENGNTLVGAKLQLTNADGDVISTWNSTPTPQLFNKLEKGIYTLTELSAPDGFEIAAPVQFEVLNDSELIKVTMTDKKIPVVPPVEMFLSKQDIATKKELPGAEMTLTEKNTGKIIDSWISTNTSHKVKVMEGVEYILTEVTAPNGYVKAESITFIAKAGESITMYDDFTKVSILKVDENGNTLAGAKLQLSKEDGTVVKVWTSTSEPLLFNRLTPGSYVLTELESPNGFDIARPITFTIKEDSKLVKVVMTDVRTPEDIPVEMYISKQDITSKTELPGATLKLIDRETGKIVDAWISTKNIHMVKVFEGKEYILIEESAPDGYLKAESITFTAGAKKTVTMYDDYTKLQISKQDATSNEELPGARLTLKDSEGNIVDSWISGKTPHLITKLVPGVYTLIEESAPDGYQVTESITFEIKSTGEIQKVVMFDEVQPPNTSAVTTANYNSIVMLCTSVVLACIGVGLLYKSRNKKDLEA